MIWILDGYNIILTDNKLGRIARNNLESARDTLIREILSSGRTMRDQFVLVFDGKGGGSIERITGQFEVRFTENRETADDLIKSLIGSQNRRRSTCVVSSDLSIAYFGKECGAKVISSRSFLSTIRARQKEKRMDDSTKEKPSPTTKDDAVLLKLFREKRDEI